MLQKVMGPTCVWMRAGVIRFWLCDRDFDCERCPLDAALRGPRSSLPPPDSRPDPDLLVPRPGDPEEPHH